MPDIISAPSKQYCILLVGTGTPTQTMGDIGGAGLAVIQIAETLAKRDRVMVLPWWTAKPVFTGKNPVINGVEYLQRRFTLTQIMRTLRFLFTGSFRTTFRHSRGINRIKYALSYAFDRAHIENMLAHNTVDIIHIHGFGLSYLPYMDAADSWGIPLVCTSHGPNKLDCANGAEFSRSYEAYVLRRLAQTAGATITAVSTGVKQSYVNRLDIPSDRIAVIGNGVDSGLFAHSHKSKSELRKLYSLPQDKFILCQVATLNRRKNHISVLQALADMAPGLKQHLVYLIVGEGSEAGMLSRFAAENRLTQSVLFAGFVTPGEELSDMYHLSDMFILPSISEGMPLVLLEAMAAGLPIITFADLEGVQDIFTPDCMELISDRNTVSMIAAIQRAVAKKWDRETIIHHNAFRTWEHVCDQYRDVYKVACVNRENRHQTGAPFARR